MTMTTLNTVLAYKFYLLQNTASRKGNLYARALKIMHSDHIPCSMAEVYSHSERKGFLDALKTEIQKLLGQLCR